MPSSQTVLLLHNDQWLSTNENLSYVVARPQVVASYSEPNFLGWAYPKVRCLNSNLSGLTLAHHCTVTAPKSLTRAAEHSSFLSLPSSSLSPLVLQPARRPTQPHPVPLYRPAPKGV